MSLFSRLRRKKYFRYDLFVNEGNGWKKFGDFVEYLAYEDIEDPIPGSVLKLYGVKQDLNRKEGFVRKSLWEHDVPMPGGGKVSADVKKEKPVEERLMEKLIENADFTNLKPSKMSIPFGKSGSTLDFEAPMTGMGEMPPLEFEGKLPAWMHPAAATVITSFLDRAGGIIKSSIGSAISDSTGIKVKDSAAKESGESKAEVEKPPDMTGELDRLLDEGKKEDKKEDTKEDGKEESDEK